VPFACTIQRPAPASAQPEEKGEEPADGPSRRKLPTLPIDSGPPPRIECDSYKAEFGEVYRGEKLFHTFRVKNSGAGELVIQEIRSNCSCAVARLEIEGKTYGEEDLRKRTEKKRIGAIGSGEEAVLEVELKTTKATVPGRDVPLSKQIRIVSNDPARPSLALTLEATMISPFTIEPEKLDFGRVRKGTGGTASAVIYSDRLGAFEIAGARAAADRFLEVKCTRVEDGGNHPPAWRIDATVTQDAPLGNYNTHIELDVNHERVKEIAIPVFLSVAPSVSFRGNRADGGDFLDFDIMNGEADKTVELTVQNEDPRVPYVPTSVKVEARPLSDAFKAELVEVEKGVKYLVKVTAPKTLAKSRFFRGDVVITADHPDLPVKKVPFRGWFRAERG
jgi:hypothetical protein